MDADDHYAVLGVERTASDDEIKKAYRRLTLQYHPDRHPGDAEVAERYRKINRAYNTLSDPHARARWESDRRMQQGIELSRNFDAQAARDLLSGVFGDVFGTRRRERRRGRDLKYTLTIDFADAVLGSNHDIEFDAPGPCDVCTGTGTRPGGEPPKRCEVCDGRGEIKGEGLLSRRTACGRCDGTGMLQSEPCETCRGRGMRRFARAFCVRIPAGSESGAQRVLEGQGEPGRFGGRPGDLRVTVNLRPHPMLKRVGEEIRCDVTVSVTEAAFGEKVRVPTVDGVAIVDVPPGVATGTRLRLRGKGVPATGSKGRTRGDQIVTVRIETPQDVAQTGALADALRALEEQCAAPGVLPTRERERAVVADDDAEH